MEFTLEYEIDGAKESTVFESDISILDFLAEIIYMQDMYKRGRITQAENFRDKLAAKLDDLMSAK